MYCFILFDVYSEAKKNQALPFTFWALGTGMANLKFNKTVAFRALFPKQAFSKFQILTAQALP